MTISYLVKKDEGDEAYLIGTNDANEATHFEKDGKQFPISELSQSDMQQAPSGNEADETPLLLPSDVTNEGKKKKTVDNDVLDLPKLDFSVTHTEDQTELKTHKAEEKNSDVLDVPKW